jgi:hypothetical protein
LYGYVRNNSINSNDLIGLYTVAAPANAFEIITKITLWGSLRAAGIGAATGAAIGYPVGQIDLGEEWAPDTKICDVASDSLTEGAGWWKTLLMAGMSWLAGHSSDDPGSLLRGGPRADKQVPPRPPTEIVAPAGPSPSPTPFFPFPLPTPRR